MALNNPYEYYIKIARKTSLIVLVLGIAVFNIVQFCRYTSVNSQKIVEYQTKQDEFAQFRNPLIAAYFFPNENNVSKKPLMAVIPKSEFVRSTTIIKEIVLTLRQKGFNFENKLLLVSNKNDAALERLIDLEIGKKPETLIIDGKSAADITKAVMSKIANDHYFIFWAMDLDSRNESEAYSSLENIAEKLNLLPEMHDLLKTAANKAIDHKIKKNSSLTLDEQQNNLLSFKRDYENILNKFINETLKGNETVLTQTEENFHLWDKGAVVAITYGENKQQINEFGEIRYDRPIIERLSASIREALQTQSKKNMTVLLLTETEEQKYQNEKDFENELTFGEHGVVLVHESRRGVMLPLWWKIYPDKKEFIKQLKIKSGLSPDYWSDEIKIYYFKTVEISNHED